MAGSAVYCDFWYCERLRDMHHPESRQWRVRNLASSKEEEKRAFLRGIKHGYAITGGAGLAWYSARGWLLNLYPMGFRPQEDWRLLFEYNGPLKPWRREPLRIWHVGKLTPDDVRSRKSSGGTFIALTFRFQARSREQLDALYTDLNANEHILMVL